MTYNLDLSLTPYVRAALGRKAKDLILLDVRGLSSVADFFIICSGRSNRQVTAIADFIQLDLKSKGIRPLSTEGKKEGHWVLLDYGHVILHVFYEPLRAFYDLESLWIDAQRINIDTLLKNANPPEEQGTGRRIMNADRFCMLMILDGWGINPSHDGNAVYLAGTPNLNRLKEQYPHTQLLTCGEAVGLPQGIMGNSEVGHLNIGAGRIVYQDILRIDLAIRDGSFFKNAAITNLVNDVQNRGASLHLLGLVSDGGVHSHLKHLLALLDLTRQKGLRQVFVHAILDGRDTPPDSGVAYIKTLQDHIQAHHHGAIATLCGRYFAMDRDNRWDRTETAYRLYTAGDGIKERDPVMAVKNAYARAETDEFVKPIAITADNDKPVRTIQDGDSVIFFNFRADRARQITRTFNDPDFDGFKRTPPTKLSQFLCMTQYDEKFTLPVAFGPVHRDKILGEVISSAGLAQLRIAETEKYAHVTYFFNGGEEKPFPLEDRCMVPSPRDVPTYDLKPEMNAQQVTAEVISRVISNKYSMIVLNFANMDMVGHTGVLAAAVAACKTVDRCAGEVVATVKARGGVVLVTADHGNAEMMTEPNGHPHTAHTLNPVPFILVDDSRKNVRLREGKLGDIAPTILEIMGIAKPEEMSGVSLIIP